MVFSMNVFKNKNVGKIKKTLKNVKSALNKKRKKRFLIYGRPSNNVTATG